MKINAIHSNSYIYCSNTKVLLVKVKKVEFVPLHAMNAYSGRSSIAPPILDIGTRLRSVVNFMLRPLYTRDRTL